LPSLNRCRSKGVSRVEPWSCDAKGVIDSFSPCLDDGLRVRDRRNLPSVEEEGGVGRELRCRRSAAHRGLSPTRRTYDTRVLAGRSCFYRTGPGDADYCSFHREGALLQLATWDDRFRPRSEIRGRVDHTARRTAWLTKKLTWLAPELATT